MSSDSHTPHKASRGSATGQPTMKDIAALAGCSVMTVSLALRNSERISKDTRARIQQIAAANDYRPNPLVAALMGSRKRSSMAYQATIGFLTNYPLGYPWKERLPAYRDFFESLKESAEQKGYGVELFSMQDPGLSPRRLQSILEARGIHALVLAPVPPDYPDISDLDWNRFSVAALGYSIQKPDFHRISHDYAQAMTTVLLRCREKGYQRVGFLMQQYVDDTAYRLWLGAYLAEQQKVPEADRIAPIPVRHDMAVDIPQIVNKHNLDAVVGLDLWKYREQCPQIGWACLNADDSPSAIAGIKRSFSNMGSKIMDFMRALQHSNDCGIPVYPLITLSQGVWINDDLLPRRFPD